MTLKPTANPLGYKFLIYGSSLLRMPYGLDKEFAVVVSETGSGISVFFLRAFNLVMHALFREKKKKTY